MAAERIDYGSEEEFREAQAREEYEERQAFEEREAEREAELEAMDTQTFLNKDQELDDLPF